MKVHQLMTGPASTCTSRDSLERAAQLLWENDCGLLPVVDDAGRVTAVITDRDICMGAYTRGKRLAEMKVADSMSRNVVTCRRDDDVAVAVQRMVEHAVRRLPVVDEKNRIQGVLSLGDLARAGARDKDVSRAAVRVLTAVTQPRPARKAPVRQKDRGEVLLASEVEREC